MKYFIHLSYKGSRYRGWQKQPNAPSVQAVLEEALAKMTGRKINCIGCGRTDAGVHARQFFGHIVVPEPFEYDPVFRLNKMLPDDIAVSDIFEVPRTVHAQHDAVWRTYEYYFHFRKDPFLSDISAFYSPEGLNLEAMARAVKQVSEARDFRSFCKQPDLYKNTLCEIASAELEPFSGGERLCFRIRADRFLRGMVRLLTGNILEVGYGRLPLEVFEDCLKNGTSAPYFKEAYPQGLYLSAVTYAFLE